MNAVHYDARKGCGTSPIVGYNQEPLPMTLGLGLDEEHLLCRQRFRKEVVVNGIQRKTTIYN